MAVILLVCTANRTRSPIAGALLRQMVGRNSTFARWRIESAGTWAVANKPPMPHAHTVMAERGLDMRAHRSRSVSAGLLHDSDLILTMEAGQKEALQVEFPEVAGRVYLLSEMAGRAVDIPDPTGGALDDYRRTAAEIERWLAAGYARIIELAQAASAAHGADGSASRVAGRSDQGAL